jgi:hypothetical protein
VTTFLKDPSATLDYTLDWGAWLAGDTIATSIWSVPTGLTLERSEFTPSQAIAWISGGVVGTSYAVTNTITTAGGRTDTRTIMFTVSNR